MVVSGDILRTNKTLFVAALGTSDFIASVGFEESELTDVTFADECFGHCLFDYVPWGKGAVALVLYTIVSDPNKDVHME